MTARGEYRPRKERELEAIEVRRIALGFTITELCTKSGVPVATYRRIRKSGRAFKRTVSALSMALRSLETERRREDAAFPFEAEASA